MISRAGRAPGLVDEDRDAPVVRTRARATRGDLQHLFGDRALVQRVAQHMTFNSENPNSLFNCIARARENARGVRETISAEMWENLNTLYWTLRDAPARFDESPEDVYRQVMMGSMLFQGLTDQTLQHDQRWHFIQLGKFLERIDVTSRVIGIKFGLLKSIDPCVIR